MKVILITAETGFGGEGCGIHWKWEDLEVAEVEFWRGDGIVGRGWGWVPEGICEGRGWVAGEREEWEG